MVTSQLFWKLCTIQINTFKRKMACIIDMRLANVLRQWYYNQWEYLYLLNTDYFYCKLNFSTNTYLPYLSYVFLLCLNNIGVRKNCHNWIESAKKKSIFFLSYLRKGKKGRGSDYPSSTSLYKCLEHAELGHTTVGSQVSHAGFLKVWQDSQYLQCHLRRHEHISSKLQGRVRVQRQSRHSYKEVGIPQAA